ncbi:CAD protein [Strongyloides ratti]|uniref:CAD protein n=1 Tax=Strongyloides ratti TaxID=34506 RepID=A0A090L5M7_STRRB|nr:CAD protein [Strongyloides ratti]CEF65096.1 CAD protein [Strongyloides ratti]
MSATLFLEDGTKFKGQLFGAHTSVTGELVFQTGMVGYVESLTDPSYAKQLLTLTYPLIGNYGVPDESVVDQYGLPIGGFESSKVWPAALIVDRVCPDGEHSHHEAVSSLSDWLKKHGVPGLTGIDVRCLTKKIRENGTLKAKIIMDGDPEDKLDFVDVNKENIVSIVSKGKVLEYGSNTMEMKILAVDCGLKYNQLRCLLDRDISIKVVPYNYPIEKELKDYDGLFISNGPGDPSMVGELIDRLKLIIKETDKPIMGICLGHQLLAKSAGASTYKLKYGNRGHNQPCTHLDTGRCFITSQNHGFAVDENTLPKDWVPLFINENDKTNEGIVHVDKPFFSIQFHPEHAAGPVDMECLFDVFVDSIKLYRQKKSFNIRNLIKEKLIFYSNYNKGEQTKVLILGSGGLTIGQAGEFDYSGAQAIKALKEKKIKTILINPNVATVQTSKGFADQTYFLPVTKEYVTDVIKKERPSGVLCTFGGQTALNCAVDLYKDGIFEQYGVEVLGTSIETIMNTEDREKFNFEIESINEKVAPSKAAITLDEAIKAASEIGYPVLVRAAFALGGLGSGFANNENELIKIAQQALAHSNQVLIDKSLKGWKEIEYEVVRDAYDNCITVCNMENVDPLGIHTGESVVVAPSQTLSDLEYNALRKTALKVIRHFGIIGECNIQYALNPDSLEYYIIEVNARLSRSSALASKATGYPLAYVAAKLALGDNLSKLRNTVTGKTTACFEPSLDYCVVKIPRWDLSKFARVSTTIGSSMKSVGEVMSIGRSFEEAFQKALRMVSENYWGFSPFLFGRQTTENDFTTPTDKRMLAISRALYRNEFSLEELYQLTKIDRWFLYRMKHIIDIYKKLRQTLPSLLDKELLLQSKQCGFSDQQIAKTIGSNEFTIRKIRQNLGVIPCVKQIDTVAAEWPAQTNYLYLTYNGFENDITFNNKNSVIVLGSGVYRIGSSVEFDACCVGCVNELKKLGYKTITVNCNPETVSTDYDMCDRLYFEEVSFEVVTTIYEIEKSKGVILAFGGQAPNNIALSLSKADLQQKMKIFGTSPQNIDMAEDRFNFSRLLDKLNIDQPLWKKTENYETAVEWCKKVGFPCLIRPSYVLSGAAMNVAHNEGDLARYLKQAAIVAKEHPVVVSKFINEAKEIDVDGVAMDGKLIAMAVSEHVENAGIHSGDATLVTPPQDLNETTLDKIKEIAAKIASALNVNGPFNLQLIAKNNNLSVIECNLRVSRSFPFVSKTLNFDFVGLATRVMMSDDNLILKQSIKPVNVIFGKNKCKKVGVKVPQFSFSRLAGADVIQGVEMASTGEVGCFGQNRYEAYLKGLISTGFVVPKKTIFISIGGYHGKDEMLNSVETLASLGFTLYASKGTADYFQSKGINIQAIEWPFEEDSTNEKTGGVTKNVSDFLANKDIDLMINLPIKGNGAYRVSAFSTHGYKTRRMAVDNGIPLITDIKCAKLFIEALRLEGCRPSVKSQIDSITNANIRRLPGLIDVHVHMREPGGEHKETWYTGTTAALAGGITTVLAMPNTNPSLINEDIFNMVESIASKSAVVDYGLFIGATVDNAKIAASLSRKVCGLKMYLNDTFSTLKLNNISDWTKHFEAFPKNKPIVCHAEKETLAAVLTVANLTGHSVHICHVAREEEIMLIKAAKDKGWNVTCEVAPHHLWLTENHLPCGVKEVRPKLGREKDIEALWKHISYIDCFATDHAPHTCQEKESENPPPGFPGVEYMLPLFLTAVSEGKLTFDQLIEKLSTNPKKIFNIIDDETTYVEVDLNEEWEVPKNGGYSKANWTPYAGMKLRGAVKKVVIRGEEVYVDGKILAKKGFGKNIILHSDKLLMRNHNLQRVFERTPSTHSSSAEEEYIENFKRSESIKEDDDSFLGQSIVDVESLNKTRVHLIMTLAENYRQDIFRKKDTSDVLKGFRMASIFYEPSTRTSCSFQAAMLQLGGSVINVDSQSSSVTKGESLEDTITTMGRYTHIIVLRHPEIGSAQRAVKISDIPVINAGDGAGQHPTQALLDLFTIRIELGTVNNLTIALVGDLKNGRTVHSLAKILCVYTGITLHLVSPTPELGMPEEVMNYLRKYSNFTIKIFNDLAEGIKMVDVVYMTRIQKERFASQNDYENVKGKFVLTPKLLNESRLDNDEAEKINAFGPNRELPIVMHPLPRVDEISTELDYDERAAYFRQMENGVYVRMALLTLLLKGCNF